MLKKSSQGFWVLEKLGQQKNLLHGFSPVEFGNMAFAYGEKIKALQNRENFVKKLTGKKVKIISLRQTHSTKIIIVDKKNFASINQMEKVSGDGLITDLKDVCLLIKTADCLPVIIYDFKNQAVALVHAGWEGVVAKIFYQAILLMARKYGTKLADIFVAIGPSICPKCYTREEGSLFLSLPEWGGFLEKKKAIVGIDLVGFTVESLKEIGIPKNHLELAERCTKESLDLFSHRRSREEREPEARFATAVCLKQTIEQ